MHRIARTLITTATVEALSAAATAKMGFFQSIRSLKIACAKQAAPPLSGSR